MHQSLNAGARDIIPLEDQRHPGVELRMSVLQVQGVLDDSLVTSS